MGERNESLRPTEDVDQGFIVVAGISEKYPFDR